MSAVAPESIVCTRCRASIGLNRIATRPEEHYCYACLAAVRREEEAAALGRRREEGLDS